MVFCAGLLCTGNPSKNRPVLAYFFEGVPWPKFFWPIWHLYGPTFSYFVTCKLNLLWLRWRHHSKENSFKFIIWKKGPFLVSERANDFALSASLVLSKVHTKFQRNFVWRVVLPVKNLFSHACGYCAFRPKFNPHPCACHISIPCRCHIHIACYFKFGPNMRYPHAFRIWIFYRL